MKRCLGWMLRLYPAAWQARYGAEFQALLDDLPSNWGDLFDILRGALLMQLSTPVAYLKLGALTAAIGALAAGAASFALPERYVSTAVMRVAAQAAPGEAPAQAQALALHRLQMIQQEVLSRRSLAEIIQRPELSLYRRDRMRYPLEDIIQEMRGQDIRIEAVDAPPGAPDSTLPGLRISFAYSDPAMAQAVVRSLVARFAEANVTMARDRSAAPPPPTATTLEVLDPASLPRKPVEPNRLGIGGIGLAAGFALGLLVAFLRRRPLRWTLWMAAAGAAGFGAALLLALNLDFDPAPFAALGSVAALALAAFLMRDRAAWRPVPYLKSALAAGILAGIAAGFASFAVPERYVSTAVLRIYPQMLPGVPAPDSGGEAAERFYKLQQEILSRGSLSELIQRPSLDLYRGERRRRPLEDIIRDMRDRGIAILRVSGPSRGFSPVTAVSISFAYPDRLKAQAVARELVTRFTEQNVTGERALGRLQYQPGAIVVEILDPPSYPQTPVAPNRLSAIAWGFGAGIVLGLLVAFLRRRPPGRAASMLRFATATGAAGAVLAFAVSFAIPNRYVSTAVLRAPSHSQPDRVPQLIMEVLTRQSLSDLITRPGSELFRKELARRPLPAVVEDLRRNIRIQSIAVGHGTGLTTAFSISVEAADPSDAHTAVQALVSRFVEPTRSFAAPLNEPGDLEVLDPATVPDLPVFPPRLDIAAAGLMAGVVAGVAVLLFRRRPLAPATSPHTPPAPAG